MDDLMGAFLSPGEKSNKTSNNNFLSLEPIRVHFREAYHSNVSLRDLKKLFHEIMRKYYHNCIKSSVKDGVVYLSLFENHNSNNNKKRKREEEENETTNPQAAKLYVYCILQKYNLETTEMKNLLGDYFSNHNTNHTIANTICIAGLKDKKAITYQRASIPFQVSPLLKTLQEQQSSLQKENETGQLQLNGSDDGWVRLVRISTSQNSVDSGLFPSPINIGDLSGNHFTIKVKHIAPSQPSENWGSVLQERFQQTCEKGLINYFGQQRFSEEADDVLTSHVGLCLVKGQYCEAVESLFKSPSQQQHKVDLQDLYWNKFPSEMHPKHIPARLKDVLAITKALRQTYKMKYGNQNTLTNADVQGRTPRWRSLCEAALRDGVPYALRTMWVHAAQSLYFNMTASALVRRLQAQPLPEEEAHALLLPLGGYQTNTERHPLVTAACLEAQTSLELTTEQLYTQRKVCGVPFSGGERALLVRPREARLTVTEERGEAVLAFYLPSSSYATVLLREVLGTDQWW
ncbi:tRNA pseudouridine13 synthase [Angomonas deanei]|uniref:tRNA pseudouridine synthase D (TruD), putative n=1 Tax=Angomonas deanei TaxID=59799 RepID=A0A7G2C829_9TRYP|nr:tRNA pseudouridine13 synthase [Angomonas deanei]CAD2216000.1 tRNA pseudouridine synthase D (TruD), putative [Angomonas deanei]|eukprot:EPY26425.1 tRNA pseudouridine13 synthase [Angomonas deanei]